MPTPAPAFNEQQHSAGKLTWDHISKLVEFWQARHGLTIDGKAGDEETIPHLEATPVATDVDEVPAALVPIKVLVEGETFKVYVEDGGV